MQSTRRQNSLTGDWVLVSPQRNSRPWVGSQESEPEIPAVPHDKNCPLCPGNQRAGDEKNPDYTGPFVFYNDFSALSAPRPSSTPTETDPVTDSPAPSFIREELARGECRVVCFDHQHHRSFADLSPSEVNAVLSLQRDQYRELMDHYRCITLFENKGEMMGCSQPHPHGQIWAHEHVSSLVATEDKRQLSYFQEHGTALLEDYAEWELSAEERLVFHNHDWLVVVPYWAAWPFETLVLPKTSISHFGELPDTALETLAQTLATLTRAYDGLFNCRFPYSMGWHNAPTAEAAPHWRLHAHFYPPLLRSATVKKHMVGYEMLGEPQRDISPEQAAAELRALANKVTLDASGQV